MEMTDGLPRFQKSNLKGVASGSLFFLFFALPLSSYLSKTWM